MQDLISRQAAIEAVSYECGELRGVFGRIEEMLIALPPAQSEITRCRDCKFYDGRPCGIVDYYNTADDFCSRAEKRENV